jgi:hypothetical protein
MSRKFKRVLTVGDLHSGHRVGLTPPEFDFAEENDRWYRIRREMWKAYTRAIDAIKPIDIMIVNGDAIDGKGFRSGGTELITTDRRFQCTMAKSAILYAEADVIKMTYGTAYHTGQSEDWEKVLADELGASIGSHEWFNINGTVFDCKHKIGSSSIPHGRGTPLAKDRFWNLIWTEFGEQPKADVVIRSHVHYFNYIGEDHWLAMTLPALQGQGSKFGARICSGTVHFGIVWFDCFDNGSFAWSRDITRVTSQKREAEKL